MYYGILDHSFCGKEIIIFAECTVQIMNGNKCILNSLVLSFCMKYTLSSHKSKHMS